MSVLTEAKIRKLFKDATIVENGIFELAAGEKLTPSARGFLADRHVQIKQSGKLTVNAENPTPVERKITSLAQSDVISYLPKLVKLYPLLLLSQKAFHREYQLAKCERLTTILKTLQELTQHRLEEDISSYHDTYVTNAELQAIRLTRSIDTCVLDYTASEGQLYCYQAYAECTALRCDIECHVKDSYADKVVQLLKAIEVMLWLVSYSHVSEEVRYDSAKI